MYRNKTIAIIIAICVSALTYSVLITNWYRDTQKPIDTEITGDEPHYLIMADSILRDRDLNLKNNYTLDAETKAIYPAQIVPHVYQASQKKEWYSVHNIGIPIVITPAFRLGGILGVRIFLGCITSLLAIPIFLVLSQHDARRLAHPLIMTLLFILAMPFLYASGQIYPDLLTGLLILTCAYLLALQNRQNNPPAFSITFTYALALGLLPYLHCKNLAPAIILLFSWFVIGYKRTKKVDPHQLVIFILPIAAILLFLIYNKSIHGVFIGVGKPNIQTRSIWKIINIFLGLHLDQAQGLLMQQPLLLLGVLGYGLWFRQSPLFASLTTLLYLSIILPNSAHVVWYGGYSMAGRFQWSASLLLIFPFAAFYHQRLQNRTLPLVAITISSITYQLLLGIIWFQAPTRTLYTHLSCDLVARNSLFPEAIRSYLPSFYSFDASAQHWPNSVFAGLTLLLFISGFLIKRNQLLTRRQSRNAI